MSRRRRGSLHLRDRIPHGRWLSRGILQYHAGRRGSGMLLARRSHPDHRTATATSDDSLGVDGVRLMIADVLGGGAIRDRRGRDPADAWSQSTSNATRQRSADDPERDRGSRWSVRPEAEGVPTLGGIIPVSRACSSVDRASASGAEGRRFESCRARHFNLFGRASANPWA